MKSNDKRLKLPFVFSNFAMTADGKIAFADREFAAFGSDHDREHMMELRATADAVMAGARTAEPPGVILGPGAAKFTRLRAARGLRHCHLRVIVSGSGSISPHADLFKRQVAPTIVLASGRAPEKRLRQLRAVADEVKVFGEAEIDFPAALHWLHEKWKVRRLLCEGGSVLHDALIRAGLLHELHLTLCPVIFGGRAAPTIADGKSFVKLADAKQFKLKSVKRVGNEIFTIFTAAKSA
jgi:5-amino-6-(5-phosphoribosylamino)uracil reductase